MDKKEFEHLFGREDGHQNFSTFYKKFLAHLLLHYPRFIFGLKSFKSGRSSTENEACSGRPKTATNSGEKKFHDLVLENRRVKTSELANG